MSTTNALRMLSVIARKDLLAASTTNDVYVTGELNALLSDDDWYASTACDYLSLV
jgi:hypothetical protein